MRGYVLAVGRRNAPQREVAREVAAQWDVWAEVSAGGQPPSHFSDILGEAAKRNATRNGNVLPLDIGSAALYGDGHDSQPDRRSAACDVS